MLLATDVAARGLDIPKVQHVIHYQVGTSGNLWASPSIEQGIFKAKVEGENREKENCWSQGLMQQRIPLVSGDQLAASTYFGEIYSPKPLDIVWCQIGPLFLTWAGYVILAGRSLSFFCEVGVVKFSM